MFYSTLTSLSCYEIIFALILINFLLCVKFFMKKIIFLIGKSKKIKSCPNQNKYSIMLKLKLKLFDQRI